MKTSRVSAFSCVSILALCAAAPLGAVDFIRGDVNEDGVVTIGDAHALCQFFFVTGEGVDCGDAADVDNDGEANVTDAVRILQFLVLGGAPPAAPFPDPGPDDGYDDYDERLPCTAYGGGEPLEDPAAALTILDAVAPGGSDRLATVLIAISSSARVAAASVQIDTGGIASRPGGLDDSETGVADLTGSFYHGFVVANGGPEAGLVRAGALVHPAGQVWVPPKEVQPFLEVQLCLEPGTPAGEYALSLVAGDMAEYGSGRRIDPSLAGGTLTILQDVAEAECVLEPLEPSRPDLLDIVFELEETTGSPGSEVIVPFFVETNDSAIANGLNFAIDFDDEVLEFSRAETVLDRPDGEPWLQDWTYAVNGEPGPGHSTELGFVTGQYWYGGLGPESNVHFPYNERFLALNLHFLVRSEAPTGTTDIRFQDGLEFCLPPRFELYCFPVDNRIRLGQASFPSDLVNSFIFINGRMNIIPDVTVFVRGDSNADGTVNISDAQYTLGFLFLGSPGPLCWDAADSNDDGKVDISDPIATLGFLFLGTGSLPPPTAAPALDPTPDNLGC